MDLPEFIGLDIGSSSVRIARVQYGSGDKPQVTMLAQNILETPVQSLNDPATQHYIAQKIKELVASAKLESNKAVAALPESMIFSKLASVPNLPEEQIEQMLFYELKNHIPVNPSEVQKDYIVLGPDPENAKMIKILLIAAPKTLVEIYKSIAKEAGLELIALETETVALARLVSTTMPKRESILIADFGHKGMDLCLLNNGKIFYSQSIGTGSDSLTKTLMADFNITYQQADQYKMKVGLNGQEQEGKVLRSLTPIIHIITNEISKLLNYFKANLSENVPKEIFLTGEGAKLPEIEKYFTDAIGVPCIKFDAVSKLPMDSVIKKEFGVEGTLGFSVAVGLAMKRE